MFIWTQVRVRVNVKHQQNKKKHSHTLQSQLSRAHVIFFVRQRFIISTMSRHTYVTLWVCWNSKLRVRHSHVNMYTLKMDLEQKTGANGAYPTYIIRRSTNNWCGYFWCLNVLYFWLLRNYEKVLVFVDRFSLLFILRNTKNYRHNTKIICFHNNRRSSTD